MGSCAGRSISCARRSRHRRTRSALGCRHPARLIHDGASEAEIAFMFRDFVRPRSTRRVELNAMTSPQFIGFVERNLIENGVAKIVPDEHLLADLYISIEKGRRIEEAIEDLNCEIDMGDCETPKDLEQRVRKVLENHPAMRWDAAVAEIAKEVADDDGPSLFEAALQFIETFEGTAGTLLDWWRSKRAERATMTPEQQDIISKAYDAKFNRLLEQEPP
jgi:hypothetical protein